MYSLFPNSKKNLKSYFQNSNFESRISKDFKCPNSGMQSNFCFIEIPLNILKQLLNTSKSL